VYNIDETALFWKLLPDKTLCIKGDGCEGGSRSKERLTTVLACNKDGSDKRQLLVIGKSSNPRGLKGAKVQYTSNQNAWMTSEIFFSWIIH
jgi:hypothetical protein